MNKTLATLFASALFVGSAFAQGDDCTVPTAINAFGTFPFDTTAATTSGFDGGGACAVGASSINQDLFWVFTTPVSGDYQFDTDGSSFDTKLSIHAGGSCAATCLEYDDDGGAGLQSLVTISALPAGTVLLIQVGGFGGNSGTGVLNVSQFVDPCLAGIDDAFEDNDTCTTPFSIGQGSYPALFASLSDSDFYEVTLQPDELLDFDCSNDLNADVDLNLFDASCNLLQSFDTDSLSVSNVGGATPLTVIVEVFVDPTSLENCTNYDLDVAVMLDPCLAGIDDAFEDNDTCTTPFSIGVGSYPALFASITDSDFYEVTLQPDQLLDFVCSNDLNADVDLNLFDASCNLLQSFNTDSLSVSNSGGAAPLTYIIEVFVDPTSLENCTNYDLDVAVMIDPCSVLPDDSFEDNDACSSPAAVAAGIYPGLFVSTSDADYYQVTVPAGNILDVVTSNVSGATLDTAIYDASCTLLVSSTFGLVSYSTIGSSTPTVLIVEVLVDPASANTCTSYDLDLRVAPDPCTLAPDLLEDNDDCAGAVTLGDGFYAGLTVFSTDNDYFAIGLDPGATLDASIFFIDADADVDLYLWDPAVECDTNVAGTAGAFLVRGFTASDDETITYTNVSGGPQDLILEVDMFTPDGCNEYDLEIMGSNGSGGGPGMNFCDSAINSTGVVSSISATGSRLVADNNVTLSATDLPRFSFGLFIVSRMQGFVMNPGGSTGNLCLTGSIGRYVGPGQIMNSGTLGEITLTIDLTAMPQPLGFEAVAPGDQWSFQLWHRDSSPAGPTSNFTDGLQIDFI